MERLQKIISQLDTVIESAKQDAVKTIYGVLVSRVFDDGEKKDGTQIGKYRSESYKNKRRAKGLQTAKIDLTFSTQLNKSVVSNTKDKILFNNSYGEIIGGFQDKRFGRIFAPTQRERDIFYDILKEDLNKLFSGNS